MTLAIMILYQVEQKLKTFAKQAAQSSERMDSSSSWLGRMSSSEMSAPPSPLPACLRRILSMHDSVAPLRLESLRPLPEVRPVGDGVKEIPDVDHLVVVAGGKRIVGEGKAAALFGLPIQLEKPLQLRPGHIIAVEIGFVNARGF
ncbi:hypothetical protein GGI42DRAFT_180213 [Trichoderma sp. SZMC 28013]